MEFYVAYYICHDEEECLDSQMGIDHVIGFFTDLESAKKYALENWIAEESRKDFPVYVDDAELVQFPCIRILKEKAESY